MRLEHLLSGAVAHVPVMSHRNKKESRSQVQYEVRLRHPSGFLYYGHLFSMYIEIFDMLTHETVE